MLLGVEESLEDKLVRILAKRPRATIHNFQSELNGFSLQGIYKELRKLQKQGIVVHVGKTFSLDWSWLLSWKALGDESVRQYEKDTTLLELGHRNRAKWQFTSLYSLNDFWSHLLLSLLTKSTNPVVYGWNPHTWFHLIQTDKESRYIQSLKLSGGKLVLLIGSKSFLDLWAEKFWSKELVEHHFSTSYMSSFGENYINVVGDFVVTVKLDSKINKEIKTLYNSTRSIQNLDIPSLVSTLRKSGKSFVILERNPKKATSFTKKIRKIFGPV